MACQNTQDNLTNILNTIIAIETELENITINRVNASIFHSHAMYAKDGEKNMRYFFGLEKHNCLSKDICSIKRTDGTIIKEQKQILQEQCRFYTSLYTSNRNVLFNMSPTKGETLVSNEDKIKLEND